MGTVPYDFNPVDTTSTLPERLLGATYCTMCSEFKDTDDFWSCHRGDHECITKVARRLNEDMQEVGIPTGGPSSYYDMPFSEWVTTNDMMEYLAEHKWGRYGIHLKDIFKGICRWGDKEGTTLVYDAKKIIYYGVRILQLAVGREKMREYLKELLNDPQFK